MGECAREGAEAQHCEPPSSLEAMRRRRYLLSLLLVVIIQSSNSSRHLMDGQTSPDRVSIDIIPG